MAKIYAQHFPVVYQSSASILAAACPSGSMVCNGYTTLVGLVYTGCTPDSACSFTVDQSSDYGATWDQRTATCVITACTSASFSFGIVGNAVKVTMRSNACNLNPFRVVWQLRPV